MESMKGLTEVRRVNLHDYDTKASQFSAVHITFCHQKRDRLRNKFTHEMTEQILCPNFSYDHSDRKLANFIQMFPLNTGTLIVSLPDTSTEPQIMKQMKAVQWSILSFTQPMIYWAYIMCQTLGDWNTLMLFQVEVDNRDTSSNPWLVRWGNCLRDQTI